MPGHALSETDPDCSSSLLACCREHDTAVDNVMQSEVDKSVAHAEGLLRSKDYERAATAADAVLSNLVSLSTAAVVRGNALLLPLMDQIVDGSRDNPSRAAFREAGDMFMLAMRLDPENAVARIEAQNMQSIIEMLLPPDADLQESHDSSNDNARGKTAQISQDDDNLDVVIVGAGASGVGVGLMLMSHFGIDRKRMLVLERGTRVGESFRQWPKEMRFISPSFNQAGWTSSLDLNSIAHGTSPAEFTLEEHPTGEQYADYLRYSASNPILHRCDSNLSSRCPRTSALQRSCEAFAGFSSFCHVG